VTVDELAAFAPDALTVQTKTSASRFAALNLHPATSRALLKQTAAAAIRAVTDKSIASPRITEPATLQVDMQTADMAEIATWVTGGARIHPQRRDHRTESAGRVPPFVALTYITRQPVADVEPIRAPAGGRAHSWRPRRRGACRTTDRGQGR
jgi:D-amino peptidase